MKYRENAQDTWHEINIKALDSMPVGTIVDYDGEASDIPTGWEQYTSNILYENASGSNQTINLSDNVSDYDHFVIVYKNTDWNEYFSYMKYDSGSAISITGNHVSSTDRDLYTFNLTMSGTTITWGTSLFSSNNGTPFAYNPFKITKVVGYK